MTRHVHAITMLAALVATGLLLAHVPAEAGNGRLQYLPGVKGYNFKASPGKIRRLCVNHWKGRFWHRKSFYGCDGIRMRWNYIRVNCRQHQLNCIASLRFAGIGGPDGGNPAPAPQVGQRGYNY